MKKQRTNEEIVKEIKYLRKEYGIPVGTFAKIMNVHDSNVRAYIREDKKFGKQVNNKLNDILNNFEFLLGN